MKPDKRPWHTELWHRAIAITNGHADTVTLDYDEARELERLLVRLENARFPQRRMVVSRDSTELERALQLLEAAAWHISSTKRDNEPGDAAKDERGKDHVGAARHALPMAKEAFELIAKVATRRLT